MESWSFGCKSGIKHCMYSLCGSRLNFVVELLSTNQAMRVCGESVSAPRIVLSPPPGIASQIFIREKSSMKKLFPRKTRSDKQLPLLHNIRRTYIRLSPMQCYH
ncbi:hypothetical protein VTO42DRAFT_316 [Malbranchea cinnamomea]